MSRVVGFIVHNWPLKLGAIALSVVLYTLLVISQNERVWPGPISTQAVDQPLEASLLDPLPDVTNIHFLAPLDIANRVSNRDFRATVDLAGIKPAPGGAPVSVPIHVEALNPRIQLRAWDPQYVSVRLDPVITRSFSVTVDPSVPEGIVPGHAEIDPGTVTVRGASSLVQRVRRVLARVTIDPNGINVDTDVDLVAVDDADALVAPVNIEPAHAHIKMTVTRLVSTRFLPVDVRVAGALPPGYAVESVAAEPVTVTVGGDQVRLGQLTAIATQPIDITGRTSNVQATIALVLPQDVRVLGAQDVKVTITIVARSGSRSYGVGLTLVGTAGDRTYRLGAQDVLVTLAGTLPALDAVDLGTLTGRLDVTGMGGGLHQVTVDVRPPPGTALVAISPAQVDVTVEQPTPRPTATPLPSPATSASPAGALATP